VYRPYARAESVQSAGPNNGIGFHASQHAEERDVLGRAHVRAEEKTGHELRDDQSGEGRGQPDAIVAAEDIGELEDVEVIGPRRGLNGVVVERAKCDQVNE